MLFVDISDVILCVLVPFVRFVCVSDKQLVVVCFVDVRVIGVPFSYTQRLVVCVIVPCVCYVACW